MTNDPATPDTDLAWPPDADAAPEGPRSALSAPDNFIAESQFNKLLHRYFGKKRWPVMMMGVLVAGAAVTYAALHTPSLAPPKTMAAKDTARSVTDASVRSEPAGIGATEVAARKADAAPGSQERRDSATEPAVPGSGADFQRQLAAAGLPNADTNPLGTTDARVTAFPPAAAVEPEATPPTEPTPTAQLPSEPPPAEKQDAAAIEPPPAKASPLPNPKLDALVSRAEQLLASGDIAKARQFFGRVAADGDARGALGMARTYDEAILRKLPVAGLAANPAQAKWWYDKAQDLASGGQPDRTGSVSAAR